MFCARYLFFKRRKFIPRIYIYFSFSVCFQYDVINIGKDGIGAVSSSGQGSLWRVEALKGRSPDGRKGVDPKDLSLVGHELGFRAEMLIEDTHTSIELFRQARFCRTQRVHVYCV